MRTKALVLTALAGLIAGSLTASAGMEKGGPARATLVAASELKWVEVPGTPAKLATVKGDSAKGAHTSFFTLPAGFSAPLHFHHADHQVVVVSGTMVLTPEGGAAKKLGPGSWFEFTGAKKHLTSCEAGADCVMAIVAKGAWDLVPADAPKATAKQ